MKLISLNIELNRRYKTVLPFLKREKPDIICLQEVLEEDFNYLKNEINMDGTLKIFSLVKWIGYGDLRGKKQGVAIFSKNILNSGSVFYEGKEENLAKPFMEYMSDKKFHKNRVFLWSEVKDNKGKIFKLINTHLPVTKNGEASSYQLRVLESLLKELEAFPEFILCGDMNAPRGNETFTRLAKKYKDNIPSKYKTSINYALHRNGKAMLTEKKQFMVDGLFTTPAYNASNVKLVDGISDHMAVVANIEVVYN